MFEGLGGGLGGGLGQKGLYMSMAQVAKKRFESLIIFGVEKKKRAATKKKRGGGGKQGVPGRAIPSLLPRRGGAPTAVLSPARRSSSVWVERGGTARPREAEWSSRIAPFLGGCYNQDIFQRSIWTSLPLC